MLEGILLTLLGQITNYKDMERQVYTVEEVSSILRVHPRTLRRAIEEGKIRAFRVGVGKKSPLRIPKEELDRIKLMDYKESVKKFLHLKNIKED